MLRRENRGDYRVTVFSDSSELWQIRYTDGTFGHEHIIDESDTHFPVCGICQRKWCPQDRNIRLYGDKMICPDCIPEAKKVYEQYTRDEINQGLTHLNREPWEQLDEYNRQDWYELTELIAQRKRVGTWSDED